MSKHEINVRIRVLQPLAGVAMQVQRGRDELLPPIKNGNEELVFEFPLTVDLAGSSPNFLGRYSQGPKDARFIYVNSGTYAGQAHTCWSRRAKLSLMAVTASQVRELLEGGWLEASLPGVGRDGGPTCASVKGLIWRIVDK